MTRLAAAGVALVLVLAGGCTKPKYTVTGTVKRGGEKLTWPDGGSLLVIFMPADVKADERYPARDTDIATSSYKIAGVPPGQYRVAVQQFSEKFMDALGGRYDPGHTDFTVEVKADGQVIDIDLPAAPAKGR